MKLIRISFSQHKNGMFSLVFTFDDKAFSCAYINEGLITLHIGDDISNHKFPLSVYNGNNPRKFCEYHSQEKNQVTFLFVPDAMLIEGQLIQVEEIYTLEVEYDGDGNETSRWEAPKPEVPPTTGELVKFEFTEDQVLLLRHAVRTAHQTAINEERSWIDNLAQRNHELLLLLEKP